MKKNFLSKIFFVIFLATFTFSSFKIITRVTSLNNEKKEFEQIKEFKSNLDNINNIIDDNNILNDSNTNHTNEKFNSLKEINDDYKCWISISNTSVDYPVVQTSNNEDYLKKSFKGEKSVSGSIFLDYRYNESSLNMVIYGHNMKDGSMFHNLRYYNSNNFNEKIKYVNIETNDGIYVYEVFSSYITSANFNYIQTNFNNKNEYMSFLNTIKNKSEIKSDLELTSEDKILTLSTCSYEFDNARRAVHGKLIEIKK